MKNRDQIPSLGGEAAEDTRSYSDEESSGPARLARGTEPRCQDRHAFDLSGTYFNHIQPDNFVESERNDICQACTETFEREEELSLNRTPSTRELSPLQIRPR